MEAIDLKRKYMTLWKDTFHVNDTYLNNIFDRFFNPEWVEYEMSGNEIVSAVMGLPYEFGGADNKIRGLYLFGLATKNKLRGQGMMSGLLDKINEKAKNAGFSFTFLMPDSERLVRYFAHHGYVKAFYRCEQNYTSLHDFHAEYDSELELQKDKVADLKRKYFDTLAGKTLDSESHADVVDKIIELLQVAESGQSDMEILHTETDLRGAIRANELCNGRIYYTETPQGVVTGVAFTTLVDRSRVDVERLYATDECSRYRLLDHIKHSHADAGIRVYANPRNVEYKNLSEVHGMARILDLYEILKFQAGWLKDLKYSILVNEIPGQVERYDIANGNVKHRSILNDSEEYDPTKTVMSLHDISSVLFRRRDMGVLITEAFGMPSVGGYICMMP